MVADQGLRTELPVAPLALVGFMASLINTLPIPLLPDLPRLLGTTPAAAYWTVTATLLVAAVATPIAGRLGDMYGKRRVLLACLALMVAGSAVCALAGSATTLIIGRALQGCAAGGLPLGLSILRDELPSHRLGRALAVMSASVGVGGTVGFPVAALLAQHADRHVLFAVVTLLGVVNLAMVVRLVPGGRGGHGGRFDWSGAVTLSAGTTCLLLALSKGREWGLAAGVALAGAGAVAMAAWVRRELSARDPLVNLRVLARGPVLLVNVATLLVGFAMFALSLVFPQVLQAPAGLGYGGGMSMVAAGFVLAPAGVAMMAVAPLAPRLAARWRNKGVLVAGCLIVGGGYGLLVLDLRGSAWMVLPGIVVGAGLALAFYAMPAVIAANAPAREIAAANGANSLLRQFGATLSSAVTSAVFAGFGLQAGYPAHAALVVALLAACLACVVAAVVAALLPGDMLPM
ncbi:MFS transporter [Nonomuraea sp. NBC_01738]|uniref:MFS transporter n=1 Tax=Nonomuraea sp. NBC_01738 TaxID=2976003 RepID=UPI002E10222D|nr:MFS transporter [Nonomuraea sp. NBC_01738]